MDIDLNILVGELLELLLKSVNLLSAGADYHAGARSANSHSDHLQSTLDNDARNACFGVTGAKVLTYFRVLEQCVTVLFATVPVGVPTADNTETVADRINFLSHL